MNTPTERKRYTSADLALLPQAMLILQNFEEFVSSDKFPVNSGIVDILDQMKNSSDRIIILNAELTHLVADIQSVCDHELYEVREHDAGYVWNWKSGEDVLLEKVCHKCRIVVPRPDLTPFEICYKCWAPMREFGVETNQNGGGTPLHHYHCTNPACLHNLTRT